MKFDLQTAHKHTSKNRAEILLSEICGCFDCKQTFLPAEIKDWINEGDGTAICPKCGVNSVIGSKSGFPLTEDFLQQMHRRWMADEESIISQSSMSTVLEHFPGAQRALFRRYHIGGCSSCGFQPTETLAQVCARNGNLDVAEVLAHIQSSHDQDALVLISPKELAELLQNDATVKLVDVRSREEFEAVNIAGSVLLSQPVMQQLMASGSNTHPIVVIDHAGKNGLDAAAYFMGHGLQNIRCLRGGIDAWAQEVEPTLRRYKLG